MKKRLESIRNMLIAESLDAFLISGRPNTYYFSGFTGTTSKCLITREKAYFITDFRYVSQAKAQVFSRMDVVRVEKNMRQTLNELCLQHCIEKLGVEGDELSYSEYRDLEKNLSQVKSIEDKQARINSLRMLKDADEIQKIRTAAQIADRVFQDILSLIKPGVKEYDIALEMEYRMKKQGAKEASFETIVASGERSALPHGVAAMREFQIGDTIVMDFGAVFQGYCSDMTRTVFLGTPSPQIKRIYDIVLVAQREALKKVLPGMKGRELDRISRDIIEEAGYGEFFGHGLGHGVGVEIHELPFVSPRGEQVLQTGMVFTVEPGIYLEGTGGVRIEDIIHLTENGADILSGSTKELIVL